MLVLTTALGVATAAGAAAGNPRVPATDIHASGTDELLADLPPAPSGPLAWVRDVPLRLGTDDGRSLGTVLEILDAAGRKLLGAGFVHGMETTANIDDRMLQVYVGDDRDAPFTTEGGTVLRSMGRPYGPTELYALTTFRGHVLAYRYHRIGPVRIWRPEREAWEDLTVPATALATTQAVVDIFTVDNRLLVFYGDGTMLFDRGTVTVPAGVLADPAEIGPVEYSGGVVSMSAWTPAPAGTPAAAARTNSAGPLSVPRSTPTPEPVVRSIVQCAWEPADPSLHDCVASPYPPVDGIDPASNIPSGLHALDDGTLLLHGLSGELYALRDGEWTHILEADRTVSWQAYTAVDWRDRVLLSQYPTANAFAVGRDGDGAWSVTEQPTTVVPSDGVHRDELQSLVPFAGGLVGGVWPWGEVYRGTYGGAWTLLADAFPLGGQDRSKDHPYEALIGRNCLGARIFTIVPWNRGFALGTTLKNEDQECRSAAQALPPSRLAEYGRVYYVERTNALSCPFVWPNRPTTLRFGLTTENRLFVSVAGRELCSMRVEGADLVERLRRDDAVVAVDAARPGDAGTTVGDYGRAMR